MARSPAERSPLAQKRVGRLAGVRLPPPPPVWIGLVATVFSIAAPAAAAIWTLTVLGSWLPADFPARVPMTVVTAVLVALGAAALAEDLWRLLRLPGGSPVSFLPLRWLRTRRAARRVRIAVDELKQAPPAPGPKALTALTELARALARRDLYTRAHSGRVSRLGVQMARRLGFSDEECEAVRLAGLFHDIGKLEIPAEILNKPGALDFEEARVLREHPIVGAGLVAPFVVDGVTDVVRHHHERVDGRGYPDELGHGGLSSVARMITVIDTYDALTSDRPYRSACPKEEAFRELRRAAGTQLDAGMVNLLIDIERSKPSFGAAAAVLIPIGPAVRWARHAMNTSAVPAASAVTAMAVAGAVSLGMVGTSQQVSSAGQALPLRPPAEARQPEAPPIVVASPPATEPPPPGTEPPSAPGPEPVGPAAPTIGPRIDLVPPVSFFTLDPAVPDGLNGWYRSDVTACLSASDTQSSVAGTFYRVNGGPFREYLGCFRISDEGPDNSIAFFSKDVAGNAEDVREVRLKLDKTPPQSRWDGTCPATVLLGSSATISVSVTDGVSGVASQSVSDGKAQLDTGAVGEKTFSVIAADQAGNTSVATCGYRVLYDASGFLRPVLGAPAVNTANAGKTVPIKWRIPDGAGGFVGDLGVVTRMTVQRVSCEDLSEALAEPTDPLSSGDSVLRYDRGENQFVFTWKIEPEMAGGCFVFSVGLNDGSVLTAYFNIR